MAATRRTRRTDARTRDWKPAFLAALDELGTVKDACKAVAISRDTAYRHRQEDEAFAVAWADVDENLTERLEVEAVRRALDGSDRLIEFLLKARRPATYRENVRVEHSGPDGGPIEQVTVPADVDRAREVAAILAEAGAAAVVNGKAAHANGNGHNGTGSN